MSTNKSDLRRLRDLRYRHPFARVTTVRCKVCLRNRWHYLGRCVVCAGVFRA